MSSHDVRAADDVRRRAPRVVVDQVPVNTSKYSVKDWYLLPEDDSPQETDTNFFGADLFRRTESISTGLSASSSTSCESSDDETDLDDVPDFGNAVGQVETDPTPDVGSWTYVQCCEKIGVSPQAAIRDGLNSEQLKLGERNLGPRDLLPLAKALKGNTGVTILDLSGNGVSGSAMLEIANALRWNNTIRKLNLSNNNLGTLGAAAVAEVMQYNTGISTLDISHNNFNDEAAKFLATGIESTDRIANLNLSNNEIGEAGGIYIGTGLKKSESVQILDLSWNKLRGKGIVMVIQSLQVNNVTTHVNLAHNGMGYEGSLAIKQMLKMGTYVVDLDISANRINWKCVGFIADGIKANENLEVLKMGKNQLTTHGCMDIIDAVSSPNCGIRQLDLTDQPVTRDFEIIAQTIKHIRDFEYKHGGFVSCHDIIGRKEGAIINPMTKLAEFLRNKKIRTTDLYKMMNKNANINMSEEEFISGLKATGIDVTEEDLEGIMAKILPKMDDKDGIVYRTLLETMREQWQAERHGKLTEKRRQALIKEYHDNILNPKLPPLPQTPGKEIVDDVVHKFRSLLRHRSMPSLPPIGGAGSRSSSPALTNKIPEEDLKVFDATDIPINHHVDLRKMAPTIMSLTRPIGAKTKQFGTNIKKKKKKKKKSHTKAKKRSFKPKVGKN